MGGERGRDRETDRQRQRDTDRQTDRQSYWNRKTKTEAKMQRLRNRQTHAC